MKNKTLWIVFCITLIGTILRLISINQSGGLLNYEAINVESLNAHIITTPLYSYYLNLWIHCFGNSDLLLRLSSIPFSILAIISMFFVGKEIKNQNVGFLAATITSLSSALIYFAQDVSQYELLFLLGSFALYSFLKMREKQTWQNFTALTLTLILIILSIPFGLKETVWANSISPSQLGYLITDLFSPILVNLTNLADRFFNHIDIWFIIFGVIPSLISIIGIAKALTTKRKDIWQLFIISLSFIGIIALTSISNLTVFLTKYMMLVYPILIAIVALGISELKTKTKNILITLFCILSLTYIITNPNSATKLHYYDGNKHVANLINNAKLTKNDYILLNYIPIEYINKYANLKQLNIISINKNNYSEYLGIKTKDEFANINKNYLTKKLDSEIFNKLKQNQKITIIFSNKVSVYAPEQIHLLIHTPDEYKKAPFEFLVFSYIRNKELLSSYNKLTISRFENSGNWSAITFIKK